MAQEGSVTQMVELAASIYYLKEGGNKFCRKVDPYLQN